MNFYEMTKDAFYQHCRKLQEECQTVNWNDIRAYHSVVMADNMAWTIKHVPAKRTFVTGINVMDGNEHRLSRKKYEGRLKAVTHEFGQVMKVKHSGAVAEAHAAGKRIPAAVRYDYPEIFTPFNESHSDKFRDRFGMLFSRFNEMRNCKALKDAKWQAAQMNEWLESKHDDIADLQARRAIIATGKDIKPGKVEEALELADSLIEHAESDLAVYLYIQKHIRNTVAPDPSQPMTFQVMEEFVGCTAEDVRKFNESADVYDELDDIFESLGGDHSGDEVIAKINEAAQGSVVGFGDDFVVSATGYDEVKRYAELLAKTLRQIKAALESDSSDKSTVGQIELALKQAERDPDFDEAIAYVLPEVAEAA